MSLSRISSDAFNELLSIHTRLSPENLCGDGEIPEQQWRKTQKSLMAELEKVRVREDLRVEDVTDNAVFEEHDRRRRSGAVRRP